VVADITAEHGTPNHYETSMAQMCREVSHSGTKLAGPYGCAALSGSLDRAGR